jgi:hypothetical protein
MNIIPSIEIHERVLIEKNQIIEPKHSVNKNTKRSNNRKTTRSRKVQYAITVHSLFPYVVTRKNIKTNK